MTGEMREADLRKHAVCSLCGQKVLHTGLPFFYRVTVERFGVDLAAARRQDGLAQFLGGHVGLAQIMGPDEVMAKAIMEPAIATVCEACSTEPTHCLAELAEAASCKAPEPKEPA